MFIDGQVVTLSYVQAIAVLPVYCWQGFGTQLMTQITQFCYDNYHLSADEKKLCENLDGDNS
jgi:GNAT superfamily N-acetyltransferase